MLPFIFGYIFILIIWAALSALAIKQVALYAYNTDTLSRGLTILYIILSIALAFNGMRILLSLNFESLFV